MRKKRHILKAVALVAATCAVASCSTCQTLRDKGNSMHPAYIYSGVRADIGALATGGEWKLPLWQKALFVIDLPISACADTICLPYTIYRTVSEPRKVAVWHISARDGGPGFVINSDVASEERRIVPVDEACSVLAAIPGKPQSVEVILSADNSVSVTEFGRIYETITSNETLTVFYRPNAIETNLLESERGSRNGDVLGK
jgi:uncharacterized protein YceK